MTINRKPIFDRVREMLGRGFKPAEVRRLDAAIDQAEGKTPALVPALPSVPKKTLAGIVGAVAAANLLTNVPQEEGMSLRAYRDIAGVWTICNGDTKNVTAGMIETEAGCRARLEAQLIAHAAPVMACTPRLAEPGRDYTRAAAVSLAYNIGVGAYCKSTVDRRFDAGNWTGGCDAFLAWNKARVKGVLRPVKGLTNRRQRERAICLKGVEE